MAKNNNLWERLSQENKRHEEQTEELKMIRISAGRCIYCGSKNVGTADTPNDVLVAAAQAGVSYDYSHMECYSCKKSYSFKFR